MSSELKLNTTLVRARLEPIDLFDVLIVYSQSAKTDLYQYDALQAKRLLMSTRSTCIHRRSVIDLVTVCKVFRRQHSSINSTMITLPNGGTSGRTYGTRIKSTQTESTQKKRTQKKRTQRKRAQKRRA